MSTSGGGFGSSANVRGTTTNDNAAAGNLGEFLTAALAVGSAVALATTVAANVTSLALTAGDWDVTGVVDYVLTGATVTHLKSGASLVTATFGAQDTFQDDVPGLVTVTDTTGEVIPLIRVSAAGAVTVFLLAAATFSAGTVSAYGSIRARRMR